MRQNSIHLPTSIINKKATLVAYTITRKSSSLHRRSEKQQMNWAGSGPNWQATDQLTMYKRSRGVEPVTNLSSGQSRTWTQDRQTTRPHCLPGWGSSLISGLDIFFLNYVLVVVSSSTFDTRFWYEVRFNINSLVANYQLGVCSLL